MTQILVGCDPEYFVSKNGILQSAHGLILGDKKNPQKVRNGAVQVDGMAVEFNIDPASDENSFVYSINDVMAQLNAMIPTYEPVIKPVAHFSMDVMKAQPEEALELGCEPDFNAWTRDTNPRPDGNRPMRTASGHVHIGWCNGEDNTNPTHVNNCNMVVKELDFYLGLPSLLYDDETQRREMYGKAGACRYKSYGVEYRTLSNAWLKSEALMRWVFRNAVKGVQEIMNGNSLVAKYGDIQHIINNSDVKAARAIIKKEKLEVCLG